jgi:hypothetical protein
MKPWMAAWFCALICLVPVRGMAQGQPVWGEVDVVSSWQAVAVTAPVIFRTDSRLPNPQLAATGVIVDVRLPWRITVSGGYLGGYLVTGFPRTSSLVGVPLVAATKTFAVWRIVAADRNVFDDFRGFGASAVRYRNRFSLDFVPDHNREWHFFGDNEAFFDRSVSKWTQNRLRLGGGRRLSESVLLDMYYLRWTVTSARTSTNVVGTTVTLALNKKREQE